MFGENSFLLSLLMLHIYYELYDAVYLAVQ